MGLQFLDGKKSALRERGVNASARVPLERIRRSRSGHLGLAGSTRRNAP
jgi:hypothetical protein